MSLTNVLFAILLTIWFLASIVWGSIWFNLLTSSRQAKQQFLNETARTRADRWGIDMLRFPVFHLLLWLANIVTLCWLLLHWWHTL